MTQRTTRSARTAPAPASTEPVDDELGNEFDDDFDTATGSAYPRMDDLDGCLLLMRPYETGTRPSKQAGQADYPWVECDVVVLQSPDEGTSSMPTDFFEGNELPFELEAFQLTGNQPTTFLLSKMRRSKRGLGVLVTGEASRGRTAPWILDTPSDAQIALAKDYVRAQRAKTAAANPWD